MRKIYPLGIAVRAVTTCFCLLAVPFSASGQQDPSRQLTQGPQGPMTVERVENGFAIAPDVKITQVDKSQARLVGAYGGWVLDGTLLVGGGGYWLANQSSAFKMAYGGAVVEWLIGTDAPIGFSARTLVGAGRATLGRTLNGVPVPLYPDDRRRAVLPVVPTGPYRVAVREHFIVAEPQADVLVRLTDRLRLDAGVGYRLIGGAYSMNKRLRGVTGSIALQFGGSHRRRSP